MNANGVLFIACRLAFDEHLNVLPETMLKEKLQATKSDQEKPGAFRDKFKEIWE